MNPVKTMAAYTVVMVRHGESAWNAENRFCGWFDADLAESGVAEAKRAGEVGLSTKWTVINKGCTTIVHRSSNNTRLL